jgi:hypothetical protein
MSFLGKIFGRVGSADDRESTDQPVRTRTFSATQFREDELARAAEAGARAEEVKIDASQVLSPAINPVAETLMSEEAEAEEPASDAETESALQDSPAAPDEPQAPATPDEPQAPAAPDEPPAPAAQALGPMDWEEAVGWLSQRSTDTRNFVGQYWNWDYDLRVLHFLAQQPDLDAGVAAHIFWITAASEDYFPFGDDEPDSEIAKQVEWLTDFLGRRFAEGAFRPASYGFDDSWDCTRLKRRLAELHDDGRLDWSPEAIPTSSTAELMSFDDVPEDEREEVTQFLARFGVY